MISSLCWNDVSLGRCLALDPGNITYLLQPSPPLAALSDRRPPTPNCREDLFKLPYLRFVRHVAIVRVSGLTRPESVEWSSTPGLQGIIDTLAFLEREEEVRGVALQVTTDGGHIARLDETSEAVRALREKKRVVTFAQDSLRSAGYWWGCQADEIICNPTALVGGLGVFTVLFDEEGYAKRLGLRRIVVSSGALKGLDFGDGVPRELIEDHKRIVHEQAAHFRAAVQDGRPSLSAEQVDALFTGQDWLGQKSLEKGLVDRVLSFRRFLDEFVQQTEPPRSTTFTTNTTEVQIMEPTTSGVSPEQPSPVEEPQRPAPVPGSRAPEPPAIPPAPATTVAAPSPPSAQPVEPLATAVPQPSYLPLPAATPQQPSSFLSGLGGVVHKALSFFGGSGSPTDRPVSREVKKQHLAAAGREILGFLTSQLSAQGIDLSTVPAHAPALNSFGVAAAREILGSRVDANTFPSTALAQTTLGDELTPEAIFPDQPTVEHLVASWSAPRPQAHLQPNLVQPTGAAEGLVPQGRASLPEETSVFDPMAFAPSWEALSQEQRDVLESEGLTADDVGAYVDYVNGGVL